MANIEISDDLKKDLQRIAQREKRSVEQITASVLEQFRNSHTYPTEMVLEPEEQEDKSKDLFTLVISAAHRLGEGSRQGNIAERSREILATDFSEYLMRRHRGQL